MFEQLPQQHPILDNISMYIHIFGWPALLGFIWLVRGKLDEYLKVVSDVHESSERTETTAMNIQAAVNTVRDNHLTHMGQSIDRLADMQEKQTTVLASLDKGIAVLAAKQTAPTFIKQ